MVWMKWNCIMAIWLAGHFNERLTLESEFLDIESGNDVPDYTL